MSAGDPTGDDGTAWPGADWTGSAAGTAASPDAPRKPVSRDHGGGIDAAIAAHGGTRADWLDLSTGINPVPYPLPPIPHQAWTALPDRDATDALLAAARRFWRVPAGAEVLPAPGLSALIARLPAALDLPAVAIPGPSYNEWAAAFSLHGTEVQAGPEPTRRLPAVLVHPNNPTGRTWDAADLDRPLALVDESFCDPMPEASHVARTDRPGTVVLKSFGKFWGLAGLRLGFCVLAPGPLARSLRESLGPWPVSGPALAVGATALTDGAWADATRARLAQDAARLDALLAARGAKVLGGTPLFRLCEVPDARAWADRLAERKVLARPFPYDPTWLRLGLPPPSRWAQLEAALNTRQPGDPTPPARSSGRA